MTNTVTSQNIELSSWDTLHKCLNTENYDETNFNTTRAFLITRFSEHIAKPSLPELCGAISSGIEE
jgi:hypothetical protein